MVLLLLLWKLAIAKADQTQSCVEEDVEDLVESEYTNRATSPFKHLRRSICIHAELFDEWEELRKRNHFKSNTVFATHLLQLFKSSKCDSSRGQGIVNPITSIGCIAR